MSFVERVREIVEHKRDPLINRQKLARMIEAGRSPRVVQSEVDLQGNTGDYVLFIPPPGHSWDESTLVPSDVEDGIVLFANDSTRPRPALVRRVPQPIIEQLKSEVADLFTFIPDPFAPSHPSPDSQQDISK